MEGDAKEDWAIIRALSAHMDRVLPYDSLIALRESLIAEYPVFGGIGHISASKSDFDPAQLGGHDKLAKGALTNSSLDFYLTNPIARASNVMAECSELALQTRAQEAAQ